MKITYPECQIEISTDEIIDLLNHFVESTSSRQHEIQEDPSVESTSSRQHESTEEPDNHEEDPAPTFEPGGFVPDDEQPAPKPYPNLTDHEAIVQHSEGFLSFIKQGLEEAEAQGRLPEELTQVEIPKEENTPIEIPIERKNESTK